MTPPPDAGDPIQSYCDSGSESGSDMGQRLLALLGLLSMFVALLLSVLLIIACLRRCRWRPLRLLLNRSSPPYTSRTHSPKVDDLETPLVSDDVGHVQGHDNNLARSLLSDELNFDIGRSVGSPRREVVGKETTLKSSDLVLKPDGSLVLDISSDGMETVQVGQTLKYSGMPGRLHDDIKYVRASVVDYDVVSKYGRRQVVGENAYKRSCLNLEVISGPAAGLHCSRDLSTNTRLQVTLGRGLPSDLLIKDSEVSGKHAAINWNTDRSRWELVDLGSLNGTLLNSQVIHHPDSARRECSDPVELANEDIITLGTSTKILVKISVSTVRPIPFVFGMASEPMAVRRGGKKLPMEDVSYCQWPLHGVEQFGLFGIFDGHGGAEAAKAASKMLPAKVANILSNPDVRTHVLSLCDASKVLREAFTETEAAMDHQYEGCTATILLAWSNCDNQLFAQCAHVGDSACVMNIGGQLIRMTEDHRVTSISEQARLREAGRALKDGETRLCGINLLRMLGDKFLKEQDSRFSAEPYVSQAVRINKGDTAFAVIASDGLWDVVSPKNVVQLILKAKERDTTRDSNADSIAKLVLSEAKNLRTKDNTSVVFLDFECKRTDFSNTDI